ncbi:MAG TPA: adenylate/guanylate cyclase domain-containing protein [Actinomycetota bacterium]|nr:adenylate/guanylate cyclase domain-containing protein [Actinomycetota bacterium]
MGATEAPEREGLLTRARLGLQGLRLRFRDPALESAFQADTFRHHLANIRFAFLAGVGLWIVWGLLLRPYMFVLDDLRLDEIMRFGVFIPMLLVGFALTFTRSFERIWEWVSVAIATATLLLWVYYVANVQALPVEYGYVGVILITAFTYTLLRLRFILVMLITAIGIVSYLTFAFTKPSFYDVSKTLAVLYLVSFGFLGVLAAYRMERFTRQLFLRERQLDEERNRSDGLLLNTFPEAIVRQLKTVSGGRIAQRFDEVSVMFVDAVGSTAQAARATPEAFADALDDLFRRFDQLVERHGLEKIKTIGDAYVAVAGAPNPIADHAQASAAMALDVLAEAGKARWPSGDPIAVRVGVATGPAVAGVIGDLRFAYDLWGDTVNLANRLEAQAPPGRVLVSESTATQLTDRFEFGPPEVLDLKGKGPTTVRVLLGPSVNGPTASMPRVPEVERPSSP